jgi:Bacterial Ig-like domain (group 2)
MRTHVKNRCWINAALSTVLATLVMACGGSPAVPTISSVLVTGPTAATLKINEATAFIATAKDSSGAALTGKAFTWTSSDTNIATVDTGGVVTAKRLGTVKISATTESIKGESAVQTTYGLEMAGGVYKSQSFTGTAFVSKLRLADGTTPNATINITGPSGWNTAGTPVNLSHIPGSWGIDFTWRGSIPAVAGTYQATTTVAGNSFTGSFEINPSSEISLSTGVTISGITSTQADVSWTAPTGAKGYVVRIIQSNPSPQVDAIVAGANFRTDTTSQQFRNLKLDSSKKYYVVVLATNAAWISDNPSLPTQFNLSLAFTDPEFSPPAP